MDQNRIVLSFDRTLYGLADYDFGLETYANQVAGKLDFSQPITIVFPDNIQLIASSFTQGFFKEIKQKIGLEGIQNQVTILSAKENMKETIMNNLL